MNAPQDAPGAAPSPTTASPPRVGALAFLAPYRLPLVIAGLHLLLFTLARAAILILHGDDFASLSGGCDRLGIRARPAAGEGPEAVDEDGGHGGYFLIRCLGKIECPVLRRLSCFRQLAFCIYAVL